ALTERSSEFHGAVNAFAQSTVSSIPDVSSFVGTDFALSEQIGKDANLVVNGQLGYGVGAPQSLRALGTMHASDRHRVSVAMGYGRFTFSRHIGTPRLGQFSVSAPPPLPPSRPFLLVS